MVYKVPQSMAVIQTRLQQSARTSKPPKRLVGEIDDTLVTPLNAYSFGHVGGHFFVTFMTCETIISQTVVSTLCSILFIITMYFEYIFVLYFFNRRKGEM